MVVPSHLAHENRHDNVAGTFTSLFTLALSLRFPTGRRQFPDGEMVMDLLPLVVASPLSVDFDGGPISYESYAFSPRKASETLPPAPCIHK